MRDSRLSVGSLCAWFDRFRRREKTYEAWAAKGYRATPLVSFIVQTHNKSRNVAVIARKLRAWRDGEIIVLEDGSAPRHADRLIRELDGANEFVIRSNDLYEVITYDRAIHFARGRYVVLLQDDDDFKDLSWVERALGLFREHEGMVILGGWHGANLLPYDRTPEGRIGEYTREGDVVSRINLMKYDYAGTTRQEREPRFRFIQTVNRAPMWLDRDLFVGRLGHIDQSYAPFHTDDMEICLRAWDRGLRVGWYNAGLRVVGFGAGGMRTWNRVLHLQQIARNYPKLYAAYGAKLEAIAARVQEANRALGRISEGNA